MSSADHLRQNHAERKQVGPSIERETFHLLRRHVVGRTDDGAVRRQRLRGQLARGRVGVRQILHPLGEAEVHHLHVPVRGHHDVGGLQIAVQKPAGVRFLERLGDLSGQAQGLRQRQSASREPAIQRVAGDVLHHQEERGRVFADFEDLADVRMIDCGHGHRFVAQALPRLGIGGGVGREQFDRDPPIEAWVVGAIDLTHASRADGRENLIAAEAGAGRQRQRWQTG